MVAGHPPHGGLGRPGQHALLLCMLKMLCKSEQLFRHICPTMACTGCSTGVLE